MLGRPSFLTFLLILTATSPGFADESDDVKRKLFDAGVRVSSAGATLSAESELSRGLRDEKKLRRNIVSAQKRYEDHKHSMGLLDIQIAKLNQQLTGLNSQLANVSDVVTNNRLVGAINTLEARLRLLYQQKEKLSKSESDVHANISKARDAFVAQVLTMREIADNLIREYQRPDRTTSSLLRQYNQLNNSNVSLEPTSVFEANLRKLGELESEVLTEEIPLRRDRNTYWAGVKIGDEVVDMIVDSGASLISLPYEDALKLGLKPEDDDPEILLSLADGSLVTARKMTIDLVRLGPFTAKNVDCVVMEAKAVNAEPLLGMSFLSNFKFELDAGKSVLRITDIGESEDRPRDRTFNRRPVGVTRDRTIFPTDKEIPQPQDFDLSPIRLEVNGESIIKDGKLETPDNKTSVMRMADVVSDFDLKLKGSFNSKGKLFWLIGWDEVSSTGYVLFYDRMVTFGNWILHEYDSGQLIGKSTLFEYRIVNGELSVAVEDEALTVRFNDDKVIVDSHVLERYRPGVVMFGTTPNRYRGMRVVLDEISITETTAKAMRPEEIPAPSADMFKDAVAQDPLTEGTVVEPSPLPTMDMRSGKPLKPDEGMIVEDGGIRSTAKQRDIIELDWRVAENFELTLKGDFSQKGYLSLFFGWNNETFDGCLLSHEQLLRNDKWTFVDIQKGDMVMMAGLVSQRLSEESTIILRVVNQRMQLEIDGSVVVENYLLKNYQAGGIMLGTSPNRYGGRAIQVKSVQIKELEE